MLKLEDGSLTINLKSSPLKGKANQELIKLVAQKHRVAQNRVAIKHG
ncbi:MAG: DUF167 family protein [Cyanobacteria bacterium P01_A01_bin.40]